MLGGVAVRRGRRRSRPARRSGWAAWRARDDAQVGAGAERHDVSGRDARLGRPVAAGEQGRQQARQPRQPSAAARGRRRAERRGLERALERVARSSAGSAMAVAASRSIHGLRGDQHRLGRQRLALVGELQRRRAVAGDQQARRRVAARRTRASALGVGGLDRRGRRYRRPPPASRAGGRRSRGRRPARPSEREFRHQRDMVRRPRPSCGKARRRGAPWPASRRRRSPTYGRAAGRGRSSSSRASGSSTRCGAAAAPDGNGGRDRPSRCSPAAGSAPRPRSACG